MKLRRILTATACGLALSLSSLAAHASLTTIDVGGIESWDGLGSPNNTILSADLGAGAVVTGFGWDVEIAPVGLSWYSEATVLFTDSAGGQGVSVSPGAADGFADDGTIGPQFYSSGGILSLADAGIPDIVLADGILLLEFYDSFDDVINAVDANWISGTLTIETAMAPVPLPAGLLLLASGMVSMGFFRRK